MAGRFILSVNPQLGVRVLEVTLHGIDGVFLPTTLMVQVEQSVRFVCPCVYLCVYVDSNVSTKCPYLGPVMGSN